MSDGTDVAIIHQVLQVQINNAGLAVQLKPENFAETIIGIPGPAGAPGLNGLDGAQGVAGVGVPVGGASGQVLKKQSGADHDAGWQDEPDITGDTLVDDDGDTKISVEQSADEDKIRFVTSGNERMLIDASGNVGIGGNPARPLHVYAPGQNFVRIQGANTVGMEFISNGIVQQALSLDLANNLIFRNSTGSHSGSVYFDYKANVFFRAGGSSTVMTLTSAKNVGIGKTNPSAKLDVNGAIRAGAYTIATLPSASSTGAGGLIFISDETGGATMAFSDGTNWRRMSDRAIVS